MHLDIFFGDTLDVTASHRVSSLLIVREGKCGDPCVPCVPLGASLYLQSASDAEPRRPRVYVALGTQYRFTLVSWPPFECSEAGAVLIAFGGFTSSVTFAPVPAMRGAVSGASRLLASRP